jgi:hypothetical protein
MQGKLDEAKALLARAWQLKSGQHDLTSGRLLFAPHCRAAGIAAPEMFIGQLKTLLAPGSLPDHADVVKVWDIVCFIEHLRPQLPPNYADFLTALVAAMNDRAKLPDLEGFSEWRNQPSVPLDAPCGFRPD